MPKSKSKASKRPCKGTLYTINGNKWCVGEKKSKMSKKSRRIAVVLRKSIKSKKSKKSQKSRRRRI